MSCIDVQKLGKKLNEISSQSQKRPNFFVRGRVRYFVYFCGPEIILLLLFWLVVLNGEFPLWALDYQKAFISKGHFFPKEVIVGVCLFVLDPA